MRVRRSFVSTLAAAGIAATTLTAAATATAEPLGPPQFVSLPIPTRIAEDGLDHGHFTFGELGALPTAIAPDLGTADYSAAPTDPATNLASTGTTNASNASGSYEGETAAASRPATAPGGALIVGGSNHIYPGACSTNVCAPYAYASADGGATWSKTVLPLTWNGTTSGIGFDPAVDFDKAGTFYYSYGVAPLSGSYPNGIVVVKSTDGTAWTQAAPVTWNKSKNFDDKYWLAVDRSNNATTANRVYVSWDRNSGNNQTLFVSYSSNGGSTWSAPVKVNDGTTKFERVIGAYPAVDNNTGTVYDSWLDYAKNRIYVDRSTSGGATWGTDVIAATTHTGFGTDIGCVGGRSQGPAHALKVGPSGALYLVYADKVTNRGYDVLLTKSTNGGASWSAPVTLNDDATANDEFHPTLSVAGNGAGGDTVTVTFYDRRDDASDCLAHVYATQSLDSGTTWSANVRLSTVASSFDGNPNGPGDYSSGTPLGTGAIALHSDHRAADFEVYAYAAQ